MSMDMAHYNPTWFVLLSIVFVGVWFFAIRYNRRIKARQQANAGHKGHIMDTPSSIAAAMDADQRGDPH